MHWSSCLKCISLHGQFRLIIQMRRSFTKPNNFFFSRFKRTQCLKLSWMPKLILPLRVRSCQHFFNWKCSLHPTILRKIGKIFACCSFQFQPKCRENVFPSLSSPHSMSANGSSTVSTPQAYNNYDALASDNFHAITKNTKMVNSYGR